MRTKQHQRPTSKLFEYTGLIVLLALGWLGLSTIGTVGVTKIGSWYEGKMYPPLAPMTVQQVGADGNPVLVEMPAFKVIETKWQPDGLMLIKGTLCKAQPYDFVKVNVNFGSPGKQFEAGVFKPTMRYGSRSVGCQEWQGWLLEGAQNTTRNEWFLEITSRPSHDRWNVTQILGPFPFPPKPAI